MPEFYAHICRTLTRAITLALNLWRDILCSWIGRLDVVKISVLSKVIYRFNAILIKVPAPGCELATVVGTPDHSSEASVSTSLALERSSQDMNQTRLRPPHNAQRLPLSFEDQAQSSSGRKHRPCISWPGPDFSWPSSAYSPQGRPRAGWDFYFGTHSFSKCFLSLSGNFCSCNTHRGWDSHRPQECNLSPSKEPLNT